jgi:cytochrome c oxidase subunit 2
MVLAEGVSIHFRYRRAEPSRWSFLPATLTAMLLLVGSASAAATSTDDPGPQLSNIFAPVSTPAELVSELSFLVLAITGGIFAVVGGLLAYSIVRFRRRRDDDGREPPQVYGSNPIELAWTLVPVLIVFVLFLATTRTIVAVERGAPPPALTVTVTGYQWWWEFRYEEMGVTTANELHVPVSNRDEARATLLKLRSADVVHSFWVPRLAGKTDVIPNRENTMWIEPFETGTYLGQCAEFCGTQHANMLLRVVVHSPEDFEQWVREQRQPPVDDPRVQGGRDLFLSTACINCHTVGQTVATGTFGPDLSHLMSRETLGAGVAPNDRAHLRTWVRDPQLLKPGCLMPDMQLTEAHVDSIVDYLVTLR